MVAARSYKAVLEGSTGVKMEIWRVGLYLLERVHNNTQKGHFELGVVQSSRQV